MSLTGLVGSWEAQFLETPMRIVSLDEFTDRATHLLDVAEHASVDRLLLEGAVESFGDAVGLRLRDEREARCDPPELHLVQEVVRHVLRAMIHAQRQPAARLGMHATKVARESLSDRLECREPIADFGDVPAHALGMAVIHGAEGPHPAVLDRLDAHPVGAPHLVGLLGRDAAIVGIELALGPAMRREQLVLPHQPQHARTRDANARQAQPRPRLAMTLTHERRGRQIGADRLQEHLIADLGLRTAPLGPQRDHIAALGDSLGVDRRARELEHAAHALQPVAASGTRGDLRAHREDLLDPKGRRACLSRRRISISMVSSPMRYLASSSCRVSGSSPRSRRPASNAASARSRQASSRYVSIASSRESASSGSPRSRRNTTSFLRFALQRLTPAPALGALGGPPIPRRAPCSATSATPDFFTALLIFGSLFRFHGFTPNPCPKQPGAHQRQVFFTRVALQGTRKVVFIPTLRR